MQTTSFAPSLGLKKEGQTLTRVTNYLRSVYADANKALDSRSDFYSRLLEEDITWRQALRAGVVLPLAMVAAVVCVATAPLVALPCLAIAAWLTYRINRTDKEQLNPKD